MWLCAILAIANNVCLILQLGAADPDVNVEVLRRMNAAVTGQAAFHKADHVTPRGITSEPPAPVNPVSFMHDFRSDARVPDAAWAAMRRKNDNTCEALMAACKHRPVVFNLSLLSKALCDSRRRQEGLPNSRKLHAAWLQFWNTDILAGLVLRAQAELMYEPAALAILPQPLTAPVTDDATAVCAAMLHLSPQEFTWSALYVHFLAQTRSRLLQLDKGDLKINLQDLGEYLSGIFQPSMSRAAAKPSRAAANATDAGEALAHFWSNDALALYLLWSLVKLTGRDYDPQWPDTPEIREGTPEISASNVPHTPSTEPRPVALAPTSFDAPIVLDDAESDPPYDPHWLLGHAPGALKALSSQLSSLEQQTAASAISAVERVAQRIRDKDNATWQFLRQFASLPEDKSSWDADASARAVNGIENDTAADGHIDTSPEQTKPSGEMSSHMLTSMPSNVQISVQLTAVRHHKAFGPLAVQHYCLQRLANLSPTAAHATPMLSVPSTCFTFVGQIVTHRQNAHVKFHGESFLIVWLAVHCTCYNTDLFSDLIVRVLASYVVECHLQVRTLSQLQRSIFMLPLLSCMLAPPLPS